jgi:3-deoxy-D-manno-octulosonic-acid transferase
MILNLYRGLTDLAGPLVPLVLDRRQAAGKEDPDRRGERLGIAGRARPAGPLVWIHGASVGEAASVQVLIARILATHPDAFVLLTTGTVTSARLMAERLPGRAFHQFVPIDRAVYVRRFLDHWRPDIVLWVESEIWPNLLTAIRQRAIPAALVNARLSARSLRRWQHLPDTFRRLAGAFALVLPWDEAEGEKLHSLGVPSVGPAGNLKYGAAPPAADPAALTRLATAIAGRPAWLAASTHEGEEAILAESHGALAGRLPGLVTIVAPRHPERGPRVEALFAAAGIGAARRGGGALPQAGDGAYIADTIGEMGTLLAVARVTFVGGSLVPHGGHNPIEPAQAGSAIIHGPHMTNFLDITARLAAGGGSAEVADAASLAREVGALLTDEPRRRARAEAAARVAGEAAGAVEGVFAALEPLVGRALAGAAP